MHGLSGKYPRRIALNGGTKMIVALTIIIITCVITCGVCFSEYMGHCSENRTGMFDRNRHSERIDKLEKRLGKLEEKSQIFKPEDK